jgi:hypothetical protein
MKSLGAAAVWAGVVYGVDQIYFAGRHVGGAAHVILKILVYLF